MRKNRGCLFSKKLGYFGQLLLKALVKIRNVHETHSYHSTENNNSMVVKYFIALSLGTALLFSSCSSTTGSSDSHNYLKQSMTADEIRQTSNKLERVSNMFIGHFSNSNFVEKKNDPTLVEQEVIGVRIWPERSDGIWVYIGWFKPDFTEEALSQGVFKLQRISPDTVGLNYYNLPAREDKYRHEWAKKAPFQKFKPKDLIFRAGCDQKIVETKDEEYRVLHNPELCATDGDAGIAFIKLDIRLAPEYLDFHTSFCDAQKKALVDYAEGNKFKRLDKTTVKYQNLE